jgi:hypothetical protein
MRRRITRTLFAATAAGATITSLGFAVAGSAGAATTGHGAGMASFAPSAPPIATNANCPVTTTVPVTESPSDNCGSAGYIATGRDFRFAQALITIPNHPGSLTGANPDPQLYVALDASSTVSGGVRSFNANFDFVRVGISPCPSGGTAFLAPNQATATTCPTTGSGWVAFVAFEQPTTTPVIDVFPIAPSMMGDGVLVNAYFNQEGNSVNTTITMPDGTVNNNTFTLSGPIYTQAQALADWTVDHENSATPIEAPATPAVKVRDAQFFRGRFTTLSGQMGTFSGPWNLNALEATSNGHLPPTGTLIAQPSYLWNDGQGLGWGDAFGVWRFPF